MIRKALIKDVKTIQKIVNQYADQGQMLPRSLNELYENIRDFSVYAEGQEVVGVCALHISWEGLAEIRSLAVRADHAGSAGQCQERNDAPAKRLELHARGSLVQARAAGKTQVKGSRCQSA